MRSEIRLKTASLAGTSDLTVAAPIIPGFVPALDAVTYKTRVKRVLRALHLGRSVAHEQDFVRLVSDAVERVGRIHSVRIAVVEPQDIVLLAVTFDGAWESYVRTIWQKVARLLDLIFCNTVDYVCGGTHGYEEWGRWLRSRQVETPFLYATPGLSYDDTVYLRMHQRALLRDGPQVADAAALRTPIPPAEAIADRLIREGVDATRLGPAAPLWEPDTQPPAFRQGLRALVGLHRLGDLYPPGTRDGDGDGEVLLRAAIELLPEFHRQLRSYSNAIPRANERYREALDWFRDGHDRLPPARRLRKPPAQPLLCRPQTIQAGILEPLPDCRQGLLLLVAFASAAGMARFLGRMAAQVSVRGAALPADGITVNLALTIEGLRRAGFGEAELKQWPEEFVQGMAARAGLLGDLRLNHPKRWRLPARNWADGIAAAEPDEQADVPRIELEAVHALLQLRLCDMPPGETEAAGRARLLARARELLGSDGGATPLSLQWLRRLRDAQANPAQQVVEHFGFGDGMSDPVTEKSAAGRFFANHVHAGEALVGYGNAADEPRWPEDAGPPAGSFDALLHNGSFLVVRKLRQDLGALEDALQRAGRATGLPHETILAKMMGRFPARHPKANQPLVPLPDPSRLNDFNYRADPEGLACPFHAHIRRANPRPMAGELAEALHAGARPPRLFRRSLSYGPPHDRDETDPGRRAASLAEERGLVFMAYNASLGEQFETVQRWLAGGNSAGGASTPADPFLGVAAGGDERIYRFHDDQGRLQRMHLDGDANPHLEPRPLVRLEWGLYAFAPSTTAIGLLAARAGAAAAGPLPWDADRGRRAIAALQALEQREGAAAARMAWKAALEDAESVADFAAASIWAAVRMHHGGVLRTPYGVLVADRDGVEEVLRDARRCTSAMGYLPRMHDAFGAIFLGQDAGPVYASEAAAGLQAVATLGAQATYNVALQCTRDRLQAIVARTRQMAVEDEALRRASGLEARASLRWETTIDVRELVDEMLAVFCEQWFGLGEGGGHFVRGGASWNWQPGEPPRYPGHFMAPSRWFFQPHPLGKVAEIGAQHGQALGAAMQAYLDQFGAALHQPAVVAVLRSAAAQADRSYAARTIAGLIMGFVPTVDGVLRRVIAQWGIDGTLASLRALRASARPHEIDAAIETAFHRSLQLRTTPETLWRTAVAEHDLGAGPHRVRVQPGEIVVLGLASSTQQSLAEGRDELAHAFGGDRASAAAPTHACPGMAPALHMMKGFVTALVMSELPLRAGPAPGLLAVSGWADHPLPAAAPARLDEAVVLAKRERQREFRSHGASALPAGFANPVRSWTIGDSWLDDILAVRPDLITALRPLGYAVVNERLDHTKTGFHLAELARPEFLDRLRLNLLDAAQGAGPVPPPDLVLLSGGGNDIVNPLDRLKRTPLFGMLRPGAGSAPDALDRGRLDAFLADMRRHFESILDVVCGETGAPVAIIAYDHPVPNGQGYFVYGPWLQPKFEAAGLAGLGLRTEVMRLLIEALNDMVRDLAADQRRLGRPVHALRIAGVLGRQPDFGVPGVDEQYRRYWDDELHPSSRGYELLAAEMARQLQALGINPS